MELELLAEQVGKRLLVQKAKLSCAESCTGGWVAQVLTSIAGSSQWFDRGFVTYSNQAKEEMLHVAAHIIEQQGAVSEATVLAMVSGALQLSHCTYSVAISGIAGPSGGSKEKPVGTVWIAWGTQGDSHAKQFMFEGDRKAVRFQAVREALLGLIALLK